MPAELLKLIENFDVISFDVFDTLLLRPYLKPTDLFAKIGGETFRKERIAAEQKARKVAQASRREEVSFDEIYELLPRWPDMKQRELDEERRCLTANPEMLEVWNLAGELGKKRVIASDMYLPRQFLEEVLREKSVDGWDGFYLSCDCGAQKASGKMFARIAQEFEMPPHKILHMGDDIHADVNAPEDLGVATWRIPKIRDVFFAENPYAKQFVERFPDAPHEDFLGAMILAWHLEKCREGYCSRQKLACLFGGSVVYAFVKWIIDDARIRGIRRLLFVARDGYTPKRLVDLLAPELKTDYIYAPRSVSKPVREDGAVRPDYLKYISSLEVDPNTTAIVDGNTEFYSSQRLVDACLNSPCMGYYFIRTNNYGRSASYYYYTRGADFNQYMFLESMYCAPTMPIRDVKDRQPVYFESQVPFERIRADDYQHVSDAIVRAASVFERLGLAVDPKVLLGWLDAFTQGMPIEDELYLSHVKNASDVEHTRYHSIRLIRRRTDGWKRILMVPVKVVSRELDGYVIVERTRILGVIPFCFRYRVVHEENEKLLLGDVLASLQRWAREEVALIRILRKLYRRIRRHGEFA